MAYGTCVNNSITLLCRMVIDACTARDVVTLALLAFRWYFQSITWPCL